jgi:hypothetical protein
MPIIKAIVRGGIGLAQHRCADGGWPWPLPERTTSGNRISDDEEVEIMANPGRSDSAVQTTG